MKTLYIHIGMPKTATTSLQIFMADNQEALKKKGFAYPIFPFRYSEATHTRNGHFLVGFFFDKDGKRQKEREERAYEKGKAQVVKLLKDYNVVLSDEGIWGRSNVVRACIWQDLKELSEKEGFELKVIVYLRRQDQFISSWWNQVIKMNNNKWAADTWEEYLTRYPVEIDFCKRLKKIEDVVGIENMIVRRFQREDFYGGSVFSDFLHLFGLELDDDFVIDSAVTNTGLTGNTHEIKRLLNEFPDMSKKENLFFRKVLLECSELSGRDYPSQMFSAEEARAFMEQFEEGNKEVARKYFHSEEPLFPMNFKDTQKWEKDNPYYLDDVVRFVGASEMELLRMMQEPMKEMQEELERLKEMARHPFRTFFKILKDRMKGA